MQYANRRLGERLENYAAFDSDLVAIGELASTLLWPLDVLIPGYDVKFMEAFSFARSRFNWRTKTSCIGTNNDGDVFSAVFMYPLDLIEGLGKKVSAERPYV